MTKFDLFVKRMFDLIVSSLALVVILPVIGIIIWMARRDTQDTGLFRQERVGRHGKIFTIYKIRTMSNIRGGGNFETTITTRDDPRITPFGSKLRDWKLDELPQLWNIFVGDMSFVGPRPDVPGYLDRVGSEWDTVLALRPGITGPASLHYRNEQDLLARKNDPTAYNDEVLWPDKLRMNREYALNWSFSSDLRYIFRTIFE
jgi:lipopolysaccharide/colanic/teichoic acid biosynthesis glycosyltransferase